MGGVALWYNQGGDDLISACNIGIYAICLVATSEPRFFQSGGGVDTWSLVSTGGYSQHPLDRRQRLGAGMERFAGGAMDQHG